MNPSSLFMVLLAGASLATACPTTTPDPRPASAPPPAARHDQQATPADPAATSPPCSVVCEGAQIATVQGSDPAVIDAERFTIAETENANAVLKANNDGMTRCYRERLRAAPSAEGTVTFEILVGPDGRVLTVRPIGGDKLGNAKECMGKVIQGLQFSPPHGGGTLNIQVPYTLRLESIGESS